MAVAGLYARRRGVGAGQVTCKPVAFARHDPQAEAGQHGHCDGRAVDEDDQRAHGIPQRLGAALDNELQQPQRKYSPEQY